MPQYLLHDRMRPTPILFSLVLLLGALGFTNPDRLHLPAAVVAGVVLEPSGSPVVAARVELLSGPRVLAVDRTDAEGGFRLETDDDWVPGWLVRAERLGFQLAELELSSGTAAVEIVLTPAPSPFRDSKSSEIGTFARPVTTARRGTSGRWRYSDMRAAWTQSVSQVTHECARTPSPDKHLSGTG